MIRTTIRFDEDVYNNLRRLATAKKLSLSQLVNAKLANRSYVFDQGDIERKILESKKLFAKLAQSGKPGIDAVQAVREMRDERLDQIAKAAGI